MLYEKSLQKIKEHLEKLDESVWINLDGTFVQVPDDGEENDEFGMEDVELDDELPTEEI